MTFLQGVLNLAVRRGAIPTNPLRYLGKLPEAERVPEALSARQVQALIAALDEYEALAAPTAPATTSHDHRSCRLGGVHQHRNKILDAKIRDLEERFNKT